MSFKPEFKVYGDPKFYQNGQAFATADEAQQSAADRFMRWTMAGEYRVAESAEPVTYKRENNRDVSIRA